MNGKRKLVLGVGGILLLTLFLSMCARRRGEMPGTVVVHRGALEVWSVCDGYLQSRTVSPVMSRLSGAATIVELIADGTPVAAGDVLVRFDSAQVERDVLRLARDEALAREDLGALEKARLPMELRDLEMRVAEARGKLGDEQQFLADNGELVEQQLISELELKQQKARVEAAAAAVSALEQQLELTREYLHPSALERARATSLSAGQELALARDQLSNCTVRAAVAGVVAYKALALGGDYRTVRLGDTVYKNQPFMTVSDMSALLMRADIPESDLSRFRPDAPVEIRPLACPDLRLEGRVEGVGATARSVAGRPAGVRYFELALGLKQSDPRLRSGMTAGARVLSHARRDTLLVPRAAVSWEGGMPSCVLRRAMGSERRAIVVGMGNETDFELMDGLAEGDKLVVR